MCSSITAVSGLSKVAESPVKGPGLGVWPTCLWPNSLADYASLLRKCTENVNKPYIHKCNGFILQVSTIASNLKSPSIRHSCKTPAFFVSLAIKLFSN